MKDSIDVPSVKALGIFERAIDISAPVARAAFVKQACGSNKSLLAGVKRLLENYTEGDAFQQFGKAISEKVGDTIDKYELLREIGEGGCGVVYLAEQQKPLHRHVALKVIKPGMDTKQVVRRFEDERQALATLEHSSIAKVYDAGVTSFGRPYFVMEWVQGKRITDYADSHNLTIRLRLQLFIRVCKAVQYAHEKGIIHRDIKPSNILVAEENGEPLPKVIDFGIAKATFRGQHDSYSLATAAGQFIGTPSYVSPEQANGRNVDRRTDVYSLGVLLYELLTGLLPLNFDGLGYAEQLCTICETEPKRPSARISGMTEEEVHAAAGRRNITPSVLNHSIGDKLDQIVMKCLAKNLEERYETASSLASDIHLYLEGDGVTLNGGTNPMALS